MNRQYTLYSCAVIRYDLHSNSQTLIPRRSWRRQMWLWSLRYWPGFLLLLTLRVTFSSTEMRTATWRWLDIFFNHKKIDSLHTEMYSCVRQLRYYTVVTFIIQRMHPHNETTKFDRVEGWYNLFYSALGEHRATVSLTILWPNGNV